MFFQMTTSRLPNKAKTQSKLCHKLCNVDTIYESYTFQRFECTFMVFIWELNSSYYYLLHYKGCQGFNSIDQEL